jgi:hypothetical protein
VKTIYKYPLLIEEILLPKNSVVLSVATQDDWIVIYAIVDTNETTEETHYFYIYDTGSELPKNMSKQRFLGTVSTHGGKFMRHVFYLDWKMKS